MTWVKGHVGDGLIVGIDFMVFSSLYDSIWKMAWT